MHPIIIGIILVLAGLVFCNLHGSIKQSLVAKVVYVAGLLLVVLGLLIILFPVLAWIYKQLMDMFAIH